MKSTLTGIENNLEYCLPLINKKKKKNFFAKWKGTRTTLKFSPIISSNFSSAFANLFLAYILKKKKKYRGVVKGLFYTILMLIPIVSTFTITFIGFILIDTKSNALKIAGNWALGSICALLGSLVSDNVMISCIIAAGLCIGVTLFVKLLSDIYYCYKKRKENNDSDEYSLESIYTDDNDENIENNENL